MSRRTKLALMVVVALLLLLFLPYPAIPPLVNQSFFVARTKTSLQMLAVASHAYFNEYGKWPRGMDDFFTNPRRIRFIESKQSTNDAWGRPILYEPFDPARHYGQVLSYGRDGKPGGDGPDADILRKFSDDPKMEGL